MLQTHVIQSMSLTIQTPHEGMARRVQTRWLSGMEAALLETLEESCNQWVPADEVLFIDQLNVDLGLFAGQQLDLSEFKSRFRHLLETQLQALRLSQSRPLSSSAPAALPQRQSASELQTQALARRQLLMHYLHTGHLPWWDAALPLDLEQEAKTWFVSDSGSFLGFVADCALSQPRAFFRLVDLLEQDLIQALLVQLEIEILWHQLIEQLQWEQVHLVVQSKPSRAQKTVWAFALFQQKTAQGPNLPPDFSTTEALQQYLLNFGLAEPFVGFADRQLPGVGEYSSTPPAWALKKPEQSLPNAHLSVSHAGGLVLLASFIARAFTTLGWVQGRSFVDEPSRLRAIHWLKYLNSGQLGLPEHQYTLEKILCGLPPDEYLEPLNTPLSASERDEAAEVLASLRYYWPAVHNTSEHNLRTSFLERQGILSLNEEGNWILYVEAGSFDVLLNLLPPQISLSMIVLPWLNHYIYVEWSQR